MRTLSSFGYSSIRQAISKEGVRIQTGAFNISITTNCPSIPEHLFKLYADFPVVNENSFIDFHIRIQKTPGLRRWIRPQTRFLLDGIKPFTPLPENQASAQFEWGLNWSIASNSHQYLIIHAAVVEKDGISLILPGSPGSGKSTLCAGLVSRGWRLLSDEMTLISIDDLLIQPVPRPISLKNKSIQIINEFSPESIMGNIVPKTTKGDIAHMLPPRSSVQRQTEKAKISFIIFPKYTENSQANLMLKPKADACLATINNIFNFNILGEQGFNVVSQMIDQAQCFDFIYPDLELSISLLENMILQHSSTK